MSRGIFWGDILWFPLSVLWNFSEAPWQDDFIALMTKRMCAFEFLCFKDFLVFIFIKVNISRYNPTGITKDFGGFQYFLRVLKSLGPKCLRIAALEFIIQHPFCRFGERVLTLGINCSRAWGRVRKKTIHHTVWVTLQINHWPQRWNSYSCILLSKYTRQRLACLPPFPFSMMRKGPSNMRIQQNNTAGSHWY